MNSIKTSLNNNKKYFKSLLFLLCLGFLIGFILVKKINLEPILENVKSINNYLATNRINFLSGHILILLILIICSLSIIGLIIFPLYIIYEGICIFFNIYTLTCVFRLNGFIYGFIYNIITKGLYLILLMILFKKIIQLIKKLLIKKEKEEKKVLIVKSIKQTGIYIFILLLNDLLIYLVGNKILSIFLFIIK